MSHGRFNNPISASLAGARDLFARQALRDRLTDDDRLEGKTCLVTGANRGLGFAIATELARRGGHIIMACRSQIPEAGERVKAASGSANVETMRVDLADARSIDSFCSELERQRRTLDVTILNAGITPPKSRPTEQGQDVMFMVNYLANFILINRLLKTGTIPNASIRGNRGDTLPRIIFISSDSHRGASAIDWDEFGTYRPYGVSRAIHNYSYFKLLLNTLATETARRLANGDGIDVSVNVICPGPVNTDIIREAPLALRLVLRSVFTLFFRSPSKAVLPIAYLAASAELENRTNLYLHMFDPKEMDPKVYDQDAGNRLWRESLTVWQRIDKTARDFAIE